MSTAAALVRAVADADRRGLQLAMRAPSATAHRRLALLTRAADHSKLWAAVALAEAALGGRAGRRAALRGVLSIAASSLVVNAGLKPLLPRHRPDVVARALPFVRRPVSSSFPSGHSASAAAFAAATVMELPIAAPIVVPLAGLLGLSRATTGVHYPSDIVVGAGVGLALAGATTRIWPRLDPDISTPTPQLQVRETRLCDEGDGLVVVVNGSAGDGRYDDDVAAISAALPRVDIVEVDADDPLDEVLAKAAAHCQALGVVGGDGTISAAADAAIAADVPLAVFPGGTLNHFARDLGVASVDDTLAAIRAGTVAAVDTGTIDGHRFVNTASFGTYSEFVARREELEPAIGKRLAMVVALAEVLATSEPIEASINGRQMCVWMIFIGNGVYRPIGFVPAARGQLDDGQFDLRIIDGSVLWARLRLALALLTGRLDRSPTYHQAAVDHVTVATERGELDLAADGEIFGGRGNFDVDKHAASLLVFVP